MLVVAEPQLIKDICVKDFNNFIDRGNTSFGHPMFDRSLLLVSGEEWKQTRTIVSPTFSSGKMRRMHVLVEECVKRLDKFLEKTVNIEIDVRKVMQNYTMDVVAICAFATKIDTHTAGDDDHPFVKNARVFQKPTPRFGIYMMLQSMAPKLVKKFGFTFAPKSVINYFETTVRGFRF